MLQQLPFSVLAVVVVVASSLPPVKGRTWNKGAQSLHLLKLCVICGLYSDGGYSASLAPYSLGRCL